MSTCGLRVPPVVHEPAGSLVLFMTAPVSTHRLVRAAFDPDASARPPPPESAHAVERDSR
jgi:multisubunit Na+/H+ antiporter MnhG subunit